MDLRAIRLCSQLSRMSNSLRVLLPVFLTCFVSLFRFLRWVIFLSSLIQLSCMYGWMVGVCYHRRIKCQARMSGRGFAVGSNELTAPLIEEDFKAALAVLEAHLAAPRAFLFGGAPCFADFGLAAQIHQARIDPTVRLRHAYYMHVRAFARACVWSCVCVCAYVVRMAGRLCVCVYVYALSQL